MEDSTWLNEIEEYSEDSTTTVKHVHGIMRTSCTMLCCAVAKQSKERCLPAMYIQYVPKHQRRRAISA